MSPQSGPLLPVFVYGTLLPGESNYRRYLAGRTLKEQPATIAGSLWLVEEEDYPYLLPGRDPVHGVVMHLRPELYQEVLAAIDRLEDFDPRAPRTSLYVRQQTTAQLLSGGSLTAWCYLWNAAERPGRHLPGGDFRNR